MEGATERDRAVKVKKVKGVEEREKRGKEINVANIGTERNKKQINN